MSVLRPAQPSDLNQLLSWVADYHAFEGIKSDHAHRLRAISPLLNGFRPTVMFISSHNMVLMLAT